MKSKSLSSYCTQYSRTRVTPFTFVSSKVMSCSERICATTCLAVLAVKIRLSRFSLVMESDAEMSSTNSTYWPF